MLARTDGESLWGPSEQLLAHIADLLASGNWQRGGGKGRRPRPIERPGVETGRRTESFGTAVSVEEMRAFLDGTDGIEWVEVLPGPK